MKKKIFTLIASMLLSAACYAQSTTSVTATVTDSDSQNWISGTCSITLVPTPYYPTISSYGYNGTQLTAAQLNPTCAIDSTGALTTTPIQNSVIAPQGSTWQLTVCPKASSICGSYNFTAVGASLNVTTPLNAILPVVRFKGIPGSYGYADGEIVSPLPGSQYFNVLTNQIKTYNGTSWGVSNGTVATVNTTGLTANVPNSNVLYAVPANGQGFYRISCYDIITTAATTSSTLPNCGLLWTDADTNANNPGGTITFTSTNAGNLVGASTANGASTSGTIVIYAKASTNIFYGTFNYASSGATAMVYALHLKAEYLGQ